MFNSSTGRFAAQGKKWGSSADRQMSHYFDVDSWQEQMQQSRGAKRTSKPPKGVNWREYKKKKKLERKRRRVMAERKREEEGGM